MNTKTFTKALALLLVLCMVFPLANMVVFAVDETPAATFALGANGSATHKDGTDTTADSSYSETVNGYKLSITNGNKMYTGAIDAKGNSCLKFGTSSAIGSMKFTVPDDVTSVTLHVAKYKDKTSKINVNGTAYTLTKNSNNGEYDAIEVDTSFLTIEESINTIVGIIKEKVGI